MACAPRPTRGTEKASTTRFAAKHSVGKVPRCSSSVQRDGSAERTGQRARVSARKQTQTASLDEIVEALRDEAVAPDLAEAAAHCKKSPLTGQCTSRVVSRPVTTAWDTRLR